MTTSVIAVLVLSVLVPVIATFFFFTSTKRTVEISRQEGSRKTAAPAIYYITLGLLMPSLFVWGFWLLIVAHYVTHNSV